METSKWKASRRATVRHAMTGAVALALALSGTAAKAQNILQGDERTACEVILCLASGAKPGECSAPLAKYFSIKKPWKRLNFLKLCPKTEGSGIDLGKIVEGNPEGLEPEEPPAPPVAPEDVPVPEGMTRDQVLELIAGLLPELQVKQAAADFAWKAWKQCAGDGCQALLDAYSEAAAAVKPLNEQMRTYQAWLKKL